MCKHFKDTLRTDLKAQNFGPTSRELPWIVSCRRVAVLGPTPFAGNFRATLRKFNALDVMPPGRPRDLPNLTLLVTSQSRPGLFRSTPGYVQVAPLHFLGP
eukprot:10546355-Alexandrium_andersonii.AAC.1